MFERIKKSRYVGGIELGKLIDVNKVFGSL